MRCEENYRNFGNAIILLAANDYRIVLRKLKRYPRDIAAKQEQLQIEAFLVSGLYSAITDVDGQMLIKKLQEEP